jgi:hypothetical protein
MDPSSGPDPAAQGWRVSVIRSGESPVIVNTGALGGQSPMTVLVNNVSGNHT